MGNDFQPITTMNFYSGQGNPGYKNPAFDAKAGKKQIPDWVYKGPGAPAPTRKKNLKEAGADLSKMSTDDRIAAKRKADPGYVPMKAPKVAGPAPMAAKVMPTRAERVTSAGGDFTKLPTDERIKAQRNITVEKEADMRAKKEVVGDMKKAPRGEYTTAPAPKAPDGSKIVGGDNKFTGADGKPMRINRATGLPFGHSISGTLPTNADAAMKQRAADSVARMNAGTAAATAAMKNAPKAVPVMAADVKPSTRPFDGPTPRSDGYQAKSDVQWQRELGEATKAREDGKSGDYWKGQGKPDMAAAFPNEGIPAAATTENMSMTEKTRKQVESGLMPKPAATQPQAIARVDTMMKKRRAGGKFS